MPLLLWLMFQVPISSPQIMRIFGGRPDDVGCACTDWLVAAAPTADAAAIAVLARRMLRRLRLFSDCFALSCMSFLLMSGSCSWARSGVRRASGRDEIAAVGLRD